MTRVVPVYEPTPLGIISQLHIDVWTAITGAADEFGFKTFIELGIYRGGTGIYFLERCKREPEFLYVGVDLHPEWMDARFAKQYPLIPNAKILLGSVFDEAIKKQVVDIIAGRGLTCVFADHGGETLAQGIRVYAPLLKPGDLMVVHDYPDEIGDAELEWMLENGYEFVDRERWLGKLNTPLFRRL